MNIQQIKEKFENLHVDPDLDQQQMISLSSQIVKIGTEYYKSSDDSTFFQNWNSLKIQNEIYHDVPEKPIDLDRLLEFIKKVLIPRFRSNANKHFMAYVPSDPLPESVVFAGLTTFVNQFTGSVQGSPGASAIEALVVRWIIDLLNMPDESFGCFTSGGSMANLTAIYTGIVSNLKKHGYDLKEDGLSLIPIPLIYISDQTHNSITKALHMLGIGNKGIRVVKSNENCVMTAENLEFHIEKDKIMHPNAIPIMIISTAGTTNTGSIDELETINLIAKRENMWHHVDGAYGIFARLANHPVANLLKPINQCDSIALDCHKWLYSPYEAGITIVSHHKILKDAFEIGAEYLRDAEHDDDLILQRNFHNYSFPLTREMRGLKIWATICRLGSRGITNLITRDILKADYLRLRIKEDQYFELVGNAHLGVVCLKSINSDEITDQIVQKLQERKNFYVSRTSIKGINVIRVCILNRRSNLETIDEFVDELNQCRKLVTKL